MLTAHPTEITRRTLIHKHLQVADALMRLDRPDLTVPERAETIEELRREIAAAWETEEIRPRRPDPLDEVTSGLLIFEQTIWDALPRYLRSLDAALRRSTGRGLPLDAAPIRFGSWIGGDRDGNPHVTPAVTRGGLPVGTLARRRLVPARRRRAAARSVDDRGHPRAPRPRRRRARAVPRGAAAGRASACWRPASAPASAVGARQAGARRESPAGPHAPDEPGAHLVEGHPYESIDELIEPLALCYRSLVDTGQQIIADGRLADLLRRTAAFGLTLVRLDVRQHADRHTATLDA